MESGRPSRRRAESRGEGPSRGARPGGRLGGRSARRVASLLALSAAACIAAAASLSGCAAFDRLAQARFSKALASIDARAGSSDPSIKPLDSGKELDKAFARAFRWARSESDWLSLLKRGRSALASGKAGLYAGVAKRALRAFPKSEPIAAASVHAYLREERPRDALALFRSSLSPATRPALWAEAFVAAALDGGAAPPGTPGDYSRLADEARQGRPLLGAAAAALASGDRSGAEAWIARAAEAGTEAPAALLWDCGLYRALSSRSDAGRDSAELALMGDAAWMDGDRELARLRWERAIALDPRRSWKPYADLAALAGRGELAESYWARLKSGFLAGPPSPLREGALSAYAAWLSREGREAEALALLGADSKEPWITAGPELASAILRGRSAPEARLAAELEGIAARRPDDAAAIGAVLRELTRRGLYGEAGLVAAGASGRGRAVEYGWFYEAALRAARGDSGGARKTLEAAAGSSAEQARLFALGTLLAAAGEDEAAAAGFEGAARASGEGRDRAAAYKALGRARADMSRPEEARAAYRAAALADPDDQEAAMLSRGAAARDTISTEGMEGKSDTPKKR
jgi:hypothetical protein